MRTLLTIISLLLLTVNSNATEQEREVRRKNREMLRWNNNYLRKQYRAVRKIYRYNRQIKHRKDICYGY